MRSRASSSSGNSPEAILRLALRLWDQLDYRGVVSLCDPGSLKSWFHEYCQAVRPPTKDDLRRQLPQLSEDKLDQVLAARIEQFSRSSAVPRGTSYEELIALTPEEFALQWLENTDTRAAFLRRLRTLGQPIPHGGFAATYAVGEVEHIAENEVRVRYELEPTQGPPGRTNGGEYETLRLSAAGEWRLIARADLLRPTGSTIFELPQEVFDMFVDDERA